MSVCNFSKADLRILSHFIVFRQIALPFCCISLLLGLTGCNKKNIHVTPPNDNLSSKPVLSKKDRIGYASWYGDPYHGRHTSNGEIYNKYDMTAAHRTLPFDTLVNVENLENGRKVNVRINDRGPFVKDRIIDLSLAAARQIDMVGPGTAKVSLDVMGVTSSPFPWTIQVASLKEKGNAEKLQRRLQKYYSPVAIKKLDSKDGRFFRVLVGQYSNERLASAALKQLNSMNYDGLIVRID
jgi:peptidoglycan lytic transglycosylase